MFIHFNWCFKKKKIRILKFMCNLVIFVKTLVQVENLDNNFESKEC